VSIKPTELQRAIRHIVSENAGGVKMTALGAPSWRICPTGGGDEVSEQGDEKRWFVQEYFTGWLVGRPQPTDTLPIAFPDNSAGEKNAKRAWGYLNALTADLAAANERLEVAERRAEQWRQALLSIAGRDHWPHCRVHGMVAVDALRAAKEETK